MTSDLVFWKHKIRLSTYNFLIPRVYSATGNERVESRMIKSEE
jgi:hypothetical protein